MIFGMFGSGEEQKPEYVPDNILVEAMQLIVTALELQINSAREMSSSMPDGEAKFDNLLSSSFFYGYVMGFSNKIAADKFGHLIDVQNRGKNTQRLIQGVIANLFYLDAEPDWNAVTAWDAQAASYGMAQNPDYENGMRTGVTLGDEVLTGTNTSSVTLLGAELMKLQKEDVVKNEPQSGIMPLPEILPADDKDTYPDLSTPILVFKKSTIIAIKTKVTVAEAESIIMKTRDEIMQKYIDDGYADDEAKKRALMDAIVKEYTNA